MPTYDFECLDCSRVERDLWFSWRNVPRMKRCPACGKKRSRQIFDEPRKAQIHLNNPALYGYYHPQMGGVIEDYGHKKRLMKENQMYEGSDPVRGNRKHSEESMHDDSQPEPDQSARGLCLSCQWLSFLTKCYKQFASLGKLQLEQIKY